LRKADGIYTLENCWSFHNGVRENGTTKGGDGEGFKLGGSSSYTTSILRTVKNCLAFYERSGFSPEPDVQPDNNLGLAVYNCVAYHNSAVGFDFEYSYFDIVKIMLLMLILLILIVGEPTQRMIIMWDSLLIYQ
jgi:hypothetical protein